MSDRNATIERALRALLSDIESMHAPLRDTEGDPSAHDADRRDYFGPFAHYYDEHDETMCEGAGVRPCWPNLRISMEAARAALEGENRPRFEVRQLVGDTWENTWSDGDNQPATFATPGEAEKAVREHVRECRAAVRAGRMQDAPHVTDFRVCEVGK
jgi:hypothetical protein